ncbi:MAG: type I-C CRISPR-associated protein Cas8c/Csd1 [Pseudomonadota bacterium]
MILQALNDYYERKKDDLPPEGWVNKGVDFIVVVNANGDYVELHCLQEQTGKRTVPKAMFLPNIGKQALKHSNSGKDANLLWDNSAFLFGLGNKGKLKAESFIETINGYFSQDFDEGVSAVKSYLTKGLKDHSLFESVLEHPDFGEQIKSGNPVIVFKLAGDEGPVFYRPKVFSAISDTSNDGSEVTKGICLVSGELDQNIEPTHTVIKGVKDAQTSGASIVSFNKDSFNSYGKKKAANSPVSKIAAQRYVKALNYLLSSGRQKIQIGDATTVFWSDRINHVEDDFSVWFDEPDKDNPDKLTDKVKALLKSVDTGALPPEDDETKFFILGLSPNSARISVRFWHTGTVAEFSRKIARHFHDLEIVHREFAKGSMSIKAFLKAIAPLNDLDRIPPNVAGDWMRSILMGSPYPETLYHLALRKSKSHRSEKTTRLTHELDVEYPCAAIIKACLNRKNRYQSQHEKEMDVSLDKDNTNPGYRIGRLFAALEKIQEEASPGINATIRDRYYSSASGTPASVFPILLRMKNHHLGKLEKGREIYFEKLLGDVMSEIAANGFPPQLSLADQGRFAIGYYHQRQAFFTKSDKPETNTHKGE